MKPGTLKKLDLLALARETELLGQLHRSQASIGQIILQRAVLEGYRERLAKAWRQGSVVSAAEAVRAVQFTAASAAASLQMDSQAEAMRKKLEFQQAQLVETLLRRRRLHGLARAAARETDKLIETKTLLNTTLAGRRR